MAGEPFVMTQRIHGADRPCAKCKHEAKPKLLEPCDKCVAFVLAYVQPTAFEAAEKEVKRT